jgi:hypothetical protein
MEVIERELSASEIVVFFISRASLVSRWTQQELQVALFRHVSGEGGGVILPVYLEDADVPPLLRAFSYVDMRDGEIERLVGVIVDRLHVGSAGIAGHPKVQPD